MKKTNHPPKPFAPIAKLLRRVWLFWLGYRLFAYPLLMGFVVGANVPSGVAWQALILLPVLLSTPVVVKGKSPYGLIVVSLLGLIYLASVGMNLAKRIYENAPMLLVLGVGLDLVLILMINVWLFVLLKRLPPMHQTWQAGEK